MADLLDDAARRRADRQRRLTAQHAEEEARAQARERRLNELADEEDATWSRVDALIATRKPADYDAAVTLLTDLQALAVVCHAHGFWRRLRDQVSLSVGHGVTW